MNLEPRPSSALPQNNVSRVIHKRERHADGRGSSNKRMKGNVSSWDWKEMNTIKDDKLIINIQSEGYKTEQNEKDQCGGRL